MSSERGWQGQRKAIYLGLLVLLLLPLLYLGQPAGKSARDPNADTEFAGLLARMRADHELSPADIGEIDPAGATMQQLLFGMNCWAVSALSNQAHEQQKKEDWDGLRATLEQLVKLQPHYYKLWDFQAHNLSYNMSVEFDDYRARYKQVTVGFNFLKEGIALNKKEPRLPHRLAWYIGHKIGRADEKKFYRRLFQQDWMELFHNSDNPDRPIEKRDNWLVAKEKFLKAIDLADTLEARGIELKTTASLFFKEPAQSQINFSEAITEEGDFPRGEAAWETAAKDFHELSLRKFPIANSRQIVMLGEYEVVQERLAELRDELEKLLPGVKEKLRQKKLDAIADSAIRAALLKNPAEYTHDEYNLAMENSDRLIISWHELADQALVNSAERTKAKKLANDIIRLEEKSLEIDILRDPLNYDYWQTRVIVENTPDMRAANRRLFAANQLRKDGKLHEAVKEYEAAFCHWRSVLNKYPLLRNDSVTADEINDQIKLYRDTVQRALLVFPKKFILRDIVEIIDNQGDLNKVTFPPLCSESDPDEKAAPEVNQDQPAATTSAAQSDPAAAAASQTPAPAPPESSAKSPPANEKPAPATPPATEKSPATSENTSGKSGESPAPATPPQSPKFAAPPAASVDKAGEKSLTGKP